MASTYNLEHPVGTSTSEAKTADGGLYLEGKYKIDNTTYDHMDAIVPGKSGPFREFLLPGMGDARRFGSASVRNSSGDVEHLLGAYQPQKQKITRDYGGPFAKSTVLKTETNDSYSLEGYTQALNALAATQANAIHEVMTLKVQRFWINQIKTGAWKPFNGWESKITIFRGGLLHQSGLANWRRINSNPVAGVNNPSTLPGFRTYSTTEEELTGVGYECGWGSDVIDINWLRNVPDAPRKIKEILDFGVDAGIALRESYNRETYIQMSNMVHRAFVMCCECEPTEDSGSRVYIYDPHVAPDAVTGSTLATELGSSFKYTDATGVHTYAATLATRLFGLTDDRASFSNEKMPVLLEQDASSDPNDLMVDCYGQYHARASFVTDPDTNEAMPFVIVDMGPKESAQEIEALNFDMLERLTDQMAQRCSEAAVGSDGDVPIFGITVNHKDIDNLIRATPIEWDAWRRAEPQALISHYGISKAKTYRHWAIINDPEQLRLKPIRYVKEYTEAISRNYGRVGFRPNDDKTLQGHAVLVCVVINPKMYSTTRFGTNGKPVPVPNPAYFRAPLAIANVYVRDTFVNLLEGNNPSLGAGTEFGPQPASNGMWGFLNIRDRATNPFGTFGNFYGLLRTHVQPTKFTMEAASFIYARDTQAFKAFMQSESRIINPDYTGAVQEVAVKAVASSALAGTSAVTTVNSGTPMTLTLATTPRVALVQSSIVSFKYTGSTAGTADAKAVVLDASMWPVVQVAPLANMTIGDYGITYDESTQTVSVSGTTLKSK